MNISQSFLGAALTLALVLALPAGAEQPAAPAPQATSKAATQASYASADQAAAALADAVRSGDPKAVLGVVGPRSESWLFSGDPVADRDDWKRFLELYDAKHVLVRDGESRATLAIGDDAWPFPAPLVRNGDRWRFDAEAGREEVLKRRVGRNELDTIQTLLAIVDAEREYAEAGHGPHGAAEYAQRIMSSPGQRDGLYWAADAGEPQSPLGPLIAEAAAHGYVPGGTPPRPYHGYFFRLLTSQGPDAPGGAYDYLVRNRMIGGFAVIAWPAKYGNSGIMTFVVNHDGVVFQKDLGDPTPTAVGRIKSFNPDKSWKRVQE